MIKKDWEIKKLGELTLDKMSYGTSSPSCEYDGETRYIRITDINDNGSLNEDFVSPISYEEKHILQDGDIVFARTGATVGKAYCYHSSDAKYVYAGYLIRLRPNKKIVLPDYIFYYTKSKNYLDFIRSSQVAAAQPNVNAEKYSNLEIPIPPLEEQKRIVKILDEKFAQLETIKTNAQTNLQNAKDLFQSQLTKAFSNTTWEKKRLGNVCKIIGGGTPSKKNKNFYEGEIPWASVRDMSQDILTSTEFCITEEAVKSSSTNIIPAGNIIIATRVGLGKVCILNQNTAINQDLKGIIPINENKLDKTYLFWYFKSISDFIISNGVGATVHGVKLDFVQSLEIPLPPLPEQKRIVKELDTLSEKVRQLQEIYTKQIANCDELKQAYLQKAFEGEL